MPLILLIIGLILIVSGIHGTSKDLFGLIKGDFTGSGNFVFWVVSIMVIGSIGYIKKLQPLSDMFLVLVLLVLFLTKGKGFFDQFSTALNSTTSVASTSQTMPSLSSGGLMDSNSSGSNIGLSNAMLANMINGFGGT